MLLIVVVFGSDDDKLDDWGNEDMSIEEVIFKTFFLFVII